MLWPAIASLPALLAGQAASVLPPAIAPLFYVFGMLVVGYRFGQAIAIGYLLAATTAFTAGAFWSGVALADILFAACAMVALFGWMRLCRAQFLRERAAADTDALTGAMTARGFRKVLRREIAWGAREGRSIALVFLDLDHFKDINDCHGHEAGDGVLQKLVVELRARLLQDDHVARLGGDEFLILLRHVRGEDTIRRFRTILAEVCAGVGFGLTASVGGIILDPGSHADEESLIARTDSLMYQIKHGGKADMLFERFDNPTIELAAA